MISLFLPPLGYAETHYRFKYFFSLLKKREPEIIADVPHRLAPDKQLPVLIIVKDADRYPVKLQKLTVFIDEKKKAEFSPQILINQNYYDKIFEENITDFKTGSHRIDIKIEYQRRNKRKVCFNDNYPGKSKKPFSCYFSAEALPAFPGYVSGETHAHSNYTSDQVEFGASLRATTQMAKAMGLSYFCITDHAYDLDDMADNYLINDPDLGKWHSFLEETAQINDETEDCCIIPGQEVSAQNVKGKNIHLLIYNSQKFFKGSGDSGEQWLNSRSEHDLAQILENLDKNALAFAAHPAQHTPFLQRLLLNRANWQTADARQENLDGLQIINGGDQKEILRGIEFWKQVLLGGTRRFALAGNDAHGNFGRCRQIAVPFVAISDSRRHLFGVWRTAVCPGNKPLNRQSVIDALRSGNYFLSNGPAIRITAESDKNRFEMGRSANSVQNIQLSAKSSSEFGALRRIRLFSGNIREKYELSVFEEEINNSAFLFDRNIVINNKVEQGYMRAEVESSNERGNFLALTNPIWIEG